MGPHPAVAAIRLAVRRALHDILTPQPDGRHRSGGSLLPGARGGSGPRAGLRRRPARRARTAARTTRSTAACTAASTTGRASRPPSSSPAAAAPTRWPSPPPSPSRPRASAYGRAAVTVDHGLQPGSAERAAEVVARLAALRPAPGRVRDGTVGRGRRPRGGRPGRRATRRWTPPPSGTARPPCCSGTPATTRPRPCCSASPAAPAPVRSPAWPPSPVRAAATTGRCWRWTGRPPARPAWSSRLPVWDDPHNADPAFTRSRVRHDACPRWRRSWARAWWRRWPAPPGCPATTPTPWTPGPTRPSAAVRDRARTPPASWTWRGCTRCRAPSAAVCCAAPPSPRAAPSGYALAQHIEEVDRAGHRAGTASPTSTSPAAYGVGAGMAGWSSGR